MLKQFTKKDKRTNLEKERDSVLVIMDKMKAELNETKDENLEETISSLMNDMSHVDSGSKDYLNMATALQKLYEAKAKIKSRVEEYSSMNENLERLNKAIEADKERIAMRNRILINGGIILAEGVLMLYFEETRVITSKVFSRLPKVKL